MANDLTPSDTATLDSERVLGFCTAIGGANAHTAILARALGLPVVVGAGSRVLILENGTQAILNGDTGTLTIEPDTETLTTAKDFQEEHRIRRAADLKAAKEPATTQDGHQVEVVANIGSVADARQAIKFGAEGVGVDELSVSVPAIPSVKAQIRSLMLSTAKNLAAQALECASATEVCRTVDSVSLRSFSNADKEGVVSYD